MKKIKAILLSVLVAALLALPASAATEHVTGDTTMQEIWTNPAIVGAGLYTHSKDLTIPPLQEVYKDTKLKNYVNSHTWQNTVKGLNRMIDNYDAGIQITYPLYTEEEIAADSTKADAELYYFPAENSGGNYVLIVCGNSAIRSAEIGEGASTAEVINELGYTAFIVRYRIASAAADNGAIEDIGRAVQYITDHADQFGVRAENYAILGYSSGGQLTGVFSSELDIGYRCYGVPKPTALLLAYPVNDFFEAKAGWNIVIDGGTGGPYYYDYSISECVGPDYPAVYHWRGKNDLTLALMCTPAQGDKLEKALNQYEIPHKYVVYENAPHGVGTAMGTDAEGWLEDAIAFWQEQIK